MLGFAPLVAGPTFAFGRPIRRGARAWREVESRKDPSHFEQGERPRGARFRFAHEG